MTEGAELEASCGGGLTVSPVRDPWWKDGRVLRPLVQFLGYTYYQIQVREFDFPVLGDSFQTQEY